MNTPRERMMKWIEVINIYLLFNLVVVGCSIAFILDGNKFGFELLGLGIAGLIVGSWSKKRVKTAEHQGRE